MYVEPEVIEEKPATLSGFGNESVAEHVEQHISDANLASKIEQRDEAMDAHLHDVFDHKIGSLSSQTLTETKPLSRRKSSVRLNAAELLESFQSPEDIRKAIILKEILTPKSHDW